MNIVFGSNVYHKNPANEPAMSENILFSPEYNPSAVAVSLPLFSEVVSSDIIASRAEVLIPFPSLSIVIAKKSRPDI